MSTDPIYVDPKLVRERPRLVGELIRLAGTRAQLERQCSAVLAWLVDRSDTFARAFCELFLADDQAQEALRASDVFGARSEVPVPRSSTDPPMYADLAIAGSDRAFQLVVEIKVDAQTHPINIGGRLLDQPDAYLASWKEHGVPNMEANVKRLGLLSKGSSTDGPGIDPWRARNVSWDEVHKLLEDIEVDCDVREVAFEFRQELSERVLLRRADLAPGLRSYASELVPRVCSKLSFTGVAPTRLQSLRDYVGMYVTVGFPGLEDPQRLWVFVAPRDGRYSVPGTPDSLYIAESDRTFPEVLANALNRVNVSRERDRAGNRYFRQRWSIEDLRTQPLDEAANSVAREFRQLILDLRTHLERR